MTNALHNALDAIQESHNYNRWIYDQFAGYLKNTDTLLDIGSGTGNLIGLWADHPVREILAADVDTAMLASLNKRFRDLPHFTSLELDIAQAGQLSRLSGKHIDVITCINVLEHIEDDLKALTHMHRLLPDGGRLFLMVPALDWLYGSLDKIHGHWRRYSRNQLAALLKKAGFAVRKLFYFNFFGIITWFTGTRILKKKTFDMRTLKSLDRIVPWLNRLERRWKPGIGQSLIAICEKA